MDTSFGFSRRRTVEITGLVGRGRLRENISDKDGFERKWEK